jgi:hypothetical protein
LDQWRFLTTIGRLDIYKQGIREIFIPSFSRPRYSLTQSGRKRRNRRQEASLINNIPLAGKGNRIPTPTEWLMSAMQLGDAQPQQQQQLFSFLFFSFLIKHISRVYFYSFSSFLPGYIRSSCEIIPATFDGIDVLCACHFVHCRSAFRVPFALEIDTVEIVEWLTFRLFHKVIQSHTQKGGKKEEEIEIYLFRLFFPHGGSSRCAVTLLVRDCQ